LIRQGVSGCFGRVTDVPGEDQQQPGSKALVLAHQLKLPTGGSPQLDGHRPEFAIVDIGDQVNTTIALRARYLETVSDKLRYEPARSDQFDLLRVEYIPHGGRHVTNVTVQSLEVGSWYRQRSLVGF
jgi:hypothetical protein